MKQLVEYIISSIILSDVPKDFVAPNVKLVQKPIVADSVDEDIDVEVDISSDESENED